MRIYVHTAMYVFAGDFAEKNLPGTGKGCFMEQKSCSWHYSLKAISRNRIYVCYWGNFSTGSLETCEIKESIARSHTSDNPSNIQNIFQAERFAPAEIASNAENYVQTTNVYSGQKSRLVLR